MIFKVKLSKDVSGPLKYCKSEGIDEHGEPKTLQEGQESRSKRIGGTGFGFSINSDKREEIAHKLMKWYAKGENQASNSEKVQKTGLHIVLAWPPGHQSDPEHKMKTVRDALRAIGMGNALSLAYEHTDTKHPHVHVVVSRVNPATRKAYDNFYVGLKGRDWALQYEQDNKEIAPARERAHERWREREEYKEARAKEVQQQEHKSYWKQVTEKGAEFMSSLSNGISKGINKVKSFFVNESPEHNSHPATDTLETNTRFEEVIDLFKAHDEKREEHVDRLLAQEALDRANQKGHVEKGNLEDHTLATRKSRALEDELEIDR